MTDLLPFQQCLSRKKALPVLENSENCLVTVYLQILGKGHLKRHAVICIPQPVDKLTSSKTLFEPHHLDPNEKIRKQKRAQHLKDIKRWRKHTVKLRKTGPLVRPTNQLYKTFVI